MIDSKLENLSEPFRKRVVAFLADCKTAGLDIRIGEGKRTPETQLLYFIQGTLAKLAEAKSTKTYQMPISEILKGYHAIRKRCGLFPVSDNDALNKNITWAFESNHFDGNAVDVLVYQGGKITWNPGDAVWEKIATLAEKNGLASGHRWAAPKKDSPHIEMGKV